MKNNVFYQNRKAIEALCNLHNVDVSVGTRMFVQEAKLEDYREDLDAWEAECRKYMADNEKTLADLFK